MCVIVVAKHISTNKWGYFAPCPSPILDPFNNIYLKCYQYYGLKSLKLKLISQLSPYQTTLKSLESQNVQKINFKAFLHLKRP